MKFMYNRNFSNASSIVSSVSSTPLGATSSVMNCWMVLASLFTALFNGSVHSSHGLFRVGCALFPALRFDGLNVGGICSVVSR